MKRSIGSLLLANLVILALLVFFFPHLMVSPGHLIQGHRTLEKDCFACHSPMSGASSAKCAFCHKVDVIGVATTKGEKITTSKTRVKFHQQLTEKKCTSCHSDHSGVAKFRIGSRFSHNLIEKPKGDQCQECHQKPGDPLHGLTSDQCAPCHNQEKWKPAQFKHDLSATANREACGACHKGKIPTDSLHQNISGMCGQCHTVTQWKPASFDHKKYFDFDKDHNVKCVLCHPGNNFKNTTCYECHEHSPQKIRSEHLEEGIRDYERCALCHRNANEDDAERLWKSGRWRDNLKQ